MIGRPEKGTYPNYFEKYVAAVDGNDVLKTLEDSMFDIQNYFRKITEEQGNFRYAEGKWTVKEVLGHITDVERIFCYRLLCFARGEKNALPGFDDDLYVKNSRCKNKTVAQVLKEHYVVRQNSLVLFESLDKEAWAELGNANNIEVAITMYPWAIVGHEQHHFNVIKERYLGKLLNY